MVVVVDDFDSGFVDFGCGGGMMFDFFFLLWVWWLWWWIGDYDGGLIFYFVCGFGCVWWWWWWLWLW